MKDDLDKLLKTWEPQIPDSPAFTRNVWQRIEARESSKKESIFSVFDTLLILIARPRAAVFAVVIVIFSGAVIGATLPGGGESGANAYLKAVNPYAHLSSRQ